MMLYTCVGSFFNFSLGQISYLVPHEMSFVREISDWAIFMDKGVIFEEGETEKVFNSP